MIISDEEIQKNMVLPYDMSAQVMSNYTALDDSDEEKERLQKIVLDAYTWEQEVNTLFFIQATSL